VIFEGRGSGIVIAIGAETEFGVIFSMMQDVRTLLSVNHVAVAYDLCKGGGTANTTSAEHG